MTFRETVSCVRQGAKEDWQSASTRSKIAIIVALLAGPAAGAVASLAYYSDRGCAIGVGIVDFIASGIVGIGIAFLAAVVGGIILHIVLHIPESMAEYIEYRRQERVHQTYRPVRGVNWKRVRWHVVFWPSLLILSAGLAAVAGYAAWLLAC